LRECTLATVLERAVTRRSRALRNAFLPSELTAVVADVAQNLLAGDSDLVGTLPGPNWVIPQLRWLHEMDSLFPYGAGAPDKHAPAPPLEYQLPGLKQPPQPKLGHRLRALRRHPLSMELERNRPIALTALEGDDQNDGFYKDLSVVAIGLDEDQQIAEAAGAMHATSWLEPVLSWPDRLIAPFADPSEGLSFLNG
jgi:hypothetical protein